MTNIFSTGCQYITLHAVKSLLKVFPFPAAYAVCESVFVSPASNSFLSLSVPALGHLQSLGSPGGCHGFHHQICCPPDIDFPRVFDSLFLINIHSLNNETVLRTHKSPGPKNHSQILETKKTICSDGPLHMAVWGTTTD